MNPSDFDSLDIERDVAPTLRGVCRFLQLGMNDEVRVPMADVVELERPRVTVVGSGHKEYKSRLLKRRNNRS